MVRIHGLTIRADVVLPGLAPTRGDEADVELELVDRLPSPLPGRTRYRAGAPDDVTARVEVIDDARGHTAFRYGDGTAIDLAHHERPARIRAAIAPGQTLEDLTAYLYGPVLGYLLRAWGRLALHASCVRFDDGAVLLAGPPGAGKSTTAAALAARGATILSDDLTALTTDGDRTLGWPAFDHLRLWPEGERIVFGDASRLEPITPTWDKRRFPLDAETFADEPCVVSAIVVLQPRGDARRVTARSISPARAVIELATLTYANYLLDAPMRARELMQLGALVGSVPVRSLTPAAGRDRLDALCDAIARVAASRTSVRA